MILFTDAQLTQFKLEFSLLKNEILWYKFHKYESCSREAICNATKGTLCQ